ncbi:GlxA family transcriptional regulator [Sphingomonas jinjuensis]|uniref:GlxA family transcriptional regulator n=1 Tax=Sphingomonas jinjuensis TaxID=535907 RepID=UPI001C85F9BF|nr:GlxA family transcriptional regulator [Sphingomonas jinjuensis]
MCEVERSTAVLITLFAPDNVHLLEIAAVRDALFEANCRVATGSPYEVRLVTEQGVAVRSASGVTFVPDASIDQATGPSDTLIVVGPYGIPALPNERVMQWLRQQAGQARRYGSVCTGAFLLAHAGLFSRRRATTHWQYAANLAAAYPDVTVEPDQIFVRDGPVFSSAGVAAAIDLTLSLIEEDFGRALALAVARRLVVFLKRPGGQSQYSAALIAQSGVSGPIDRIRLLVLENPRRDLSLATLAKELGVSPRHLSRLFHAEQGKSLSDYVESTRVDISRRLLEESSAPIKAIAFAAGFGSTTTLRRAFMRALGITPHEYRTRFQSTGAASSVMAETDAVLS